MERRHWVHIPHIGEARARMVPLPSQSSSWELLHAKSPMLELYTLRRLRPFLELNPRPQNTN